ncbi:MAG: HEAT repeat domain-containing protein [Planctomycetota bacterium]
MLAVILVCCLALVPPAAAGEEAAAPSLDQSLRALVRQDLDLPRRLEAAARVLAADVLEDPESVIRGGSLLLAEAPEPGGWLVLRGLDAGWIASEVRADVRRRVEAAMEAPQATPADRAVFAAAGLLVGHRPEDAPDVLTAAWPPAPFTRAVLRRELARPDDDGADGVAAALRRQLPIARALDLAAADDPETMATGVDALLAAGEDALPLLLHEVEQVLDGRLPGRVERAARAILVVGLIGRREATPVLVRALDAEDGWLQVGAATALGDVGDPAAVPALCRKLTYRGDVLRRRDEWDYPGERETNVSAEAWPSIDYYATDCAAADALLRLGVNGAAEWLIVNKLDPSKARFRIRVLQDAVDALRRSVPSPEADAYNVDAGLPQRRDAFHALYAWSLAHRFDRGTAHGTLDPSDAGFQHAARRLVERLRGRSVMELQIAQESCALIGPAIVPTLLDVLGAADKPFLRTEIARALGAVRDPGAVTPLLGLLADRSPILRSVAAESLGAYLERDDRVAPALLARLDDPEPGPRVAALRALAAAPPSDRVRTAVQAHPPAAYAETFGGADREYRRPWTVVMLVQEGTAHWAPAKEGLAHEERAVRLAWWDLLRRALGLPASFYDGGTPPDERSWRPIDEASVFEALERRRSP